MVHEDVDADVLEGSDEDESAADGDELDDESDSDRDRDVEQKGGDRDGEEADAGDGKRIRETNAGESGAGVAGRKGGKDMSGVRRKIVAGAGIIGRPRLNAR